jgi:hypothetical protein
MVSVLTELRGRPTAIHFRLRHNCTLNMDSTTLNQKVYSISNNMARWERKW